MIVDGLKTFAIEAVRAERIRMLAAAHSQGLMQFTGRIRSAGGPGFEVPEFDAPDARVEAEVLFRWRVNASP